MGSSTVLNGTVYQFYCPKKSIIAVCFRCLLLLLVALWITVSPFHSSVFHLLVKLPKICEISFTMKKK